MDYKDTLNLPRTGFPMKADLANKEVEILEKWESGGLYKQIQEKQKGNKPFILHDGPPYANGNIHEGHALNKILKDIIIKSKTMNGFDAPYVPGWDCHGLPIELLVDKKLKSKKRELSKVEFRAHCREYADKYVDIQREEFKRLGIMGDWDNPYLTHAHDYEIGILRELAKIAGTGALYRGNKPVHWCPSCVTALAEAEVEYDDHTSPSVYVKFPLTDKSAEKLGLPTGTNMVIWTTTPWTLPANLAVCLHPGFDYSALKSNNEIYILATDLVENCMKDFGQDQYETVATFKGADFDRLLAKHPFLDQESLIIVGDHVTLEQGTGCVHTAPGHGQEDYVVGHKYDLPVYNPVNQYGVFMEETPFFAGLKVPKANEDVITLLESNGKLLARNDISHSYPHCWRCRKPIIFRATPQWFISMDKNDLRIKALEEIKKVDWLPAWGMNRIYGMVENRPDWCISRQRTWGVPITAFYCEKCDTALFDGEIAQRVAKILDKEGVDYWFDHPAEVFIADGTLCKGCGHDTFIKSSDILDVWFDSGVSHSIVVDENDRLSWPADLYLEGSDQHRGWFHTSLLESVATKGKAPYRQVLTHGYVVDGAGKKMSKSKGNAIAPQKIIDRYGAEIVRLWVAGEDYREDIRLSDEILRRLTDAYRKIRNTIRFMLGNLEDFDPATETVPLAQRHELDRLITHRFDILAEQLKNAYESYDFHLLYHKLHNFCVTDLSSFYLDIVKDRVYTYPVKSDGRLSAQSSMYDVTAGILKIMAPVLCFTADEAWGHLPADEKREKNVHLAFFPGIDKNEIQEPELLLEWDRIVAIRKEVLFALEQARREKLIGHSLDAKVRLSAFREERKLLEKRFEELPFIFIVSQVELESEPANENVYCSEDVPGLTVQVEKADGKKCDRCWNYSKSVGNSNIHPLVCERCVSHLPSLV